MKKINDVFEHFYKTFQDSLVVNVKSINPLLFGSFDYSEFVRYLNDVLTSFISSKEIKLNINQISTIFEEIPEISHNLKECVVQLLEANFLQKHFWDFFSNNLDIVFEEKRRFNLLKVTELDIEISNMFYFIEKLEDLKKKKNFTEKMINLIGLIQVILMANFFKQIIKFIEMRINELKNNKAYFYLGNNKLAVHFKPIRLDFLKNFEDYQLMIQGNNEREYSVLKSYVDQVNKFFRQFNIPYKIEIDYDLKTIKFVDEMTGFYQDISHVGFGFSQILPVIIECLKSVPQKMILIEQPEAQLHPKLQSQLADLFYKSALKNYNQLIIETHSEYLIRRFQVLIAKGTMTPDDIAIYYVVKDENGCSHVQEMELDETGQFLTEWPSGFFDESYKQAMEMLR